MHPGDAEANYLLSRVFLQQHDLAGATAAMDRAADYGNERVEAPEPSPYVGVTRCKECHPAIFRVQRSSRHAQTFRTRDELQDLPLPPRSKPDPAAPTVVHRLTRDDKGVTFQTSTPGGDRKALVEFVMGSGDRAMTLVGRDSDRAWRELRLSYYDSIRDWDRTPGQPVRPRVHDEFLGQVQNEDAIRRCLGCHTTYSRVVDDRVEVAPERGFSCERCHGPAGNHLDAVALKFSDPAIARPRLAPAERVNSLCGQCHGAAGRGLTADDPDLARFQASALPLSRCATAGGKPTMSCLTCHDPHRNSETSPAFYEAKCLKCHGSTPVPGHRSIEPGLPSLEAMRDVTKKVACPVNPSRDCVSCHMPKKRAVDGGHTVFTDHSISSRSEQPLKSYFSRQPSPRNLGLAYVAIASARHDPKYLENAWPLLRDAASTMPNDPLLYYNIANLLSAAGNKSQAITYYRISLQQDPLQPDALLKLAALVTSGEAVELRQRAQNIVPQPRFDAARIQ
jgi:hypothetical protein